MRIIHSRPDGAPSQQKSATFTGTVWADPVLPTTDGVTINSIVFTPGARTDWHEHEHGQILQVTGGRGWVCTAGEEPQPLHAGDTVWVPPGERHWHGASTTTWMAHTATSLGVTHWLHAVSDVEYAMTESAADSRSADPTIEGTR